MAPRTIDQTGPKKETGKNASPTADKTKASPTTARVTPIILTTISDNDIIYSPPFLLKTLIIIPKKFLTPISISSLRLFHSSI